MLGGPRGRGLPNPNRGEKVPIATHCDSTGRVDRPSLTRTHVGVARRIIIDECNDSALTTSLADDLPILINAIRKHVTAARRWRGNDLRGRDLEHLAPDAVLSAGQRHLNIPQGQLRVVRDGDVRDKLGRAAVSYTHLR